MATYYCHECARNNGHISPIDPSDLNANEYQLEKYLKHTAPTGSYPVNSIFNDGDWRSYQNHIVATAHSGCLEIDDGGRKNLLLFAGKKTGLRLDNGVFTADGSGVKVVLTENSGTIHGFPSDFRPESRACAACGRLVPSF